MCKDHSEMLLNWQLLSLPSDKLEWVLSIGHLQLDNWNKDNGFGHCIAANEYTFSKEKERESSSKNACNTHISMMELIFFNMLVLQIQRSSCHVEESSK